MVHDALVYRSLVWCGAVGLCSNNIPQHLHINLQLHTRPTTGKPKRRVPQAATIFITLELLMMGIIVPETCWADDKFCSKNQSVASSWHFIFHVLTTMHGQTHIKWLTKFRYVEFRELHDAMNRYWILNVHESSSKSAFCITGTGNFHDVSNQPEREADWLVHRPYTTKVKMEWALLPGST